MAWSIEAIMRNRRKRKARRTWKQQPLFAYNLLLNEFPGYSPENFERDLSISKGKIKKSGKSPLARYGRYPVMMKLLAKWETSKEVSTGLEIVKFRRNMTKPYRLIAFFGKERWCFEYPATYTIATMAKLVSAAGSSKSLDEFKEKEQGITRYLGFGQ